MSQQYTKSNASIEGNSTPPQSRFRHLVALRLANEHGLKLFPLRDGGKLPAIEGWQDAATADPAKLAKWFGKGTRNIGVATGASGLIVLDTDQKHGIDGDANLRALAAEHVADLDSTFAVESPTGSRHYYFRGSPVRNSVGKLAPAVDVRSQGGLVVAPGSVTDKGTYQVRHNAGIAPAPQWLKDAIARAYVAAEKVQIASTVELDTPAAYSTAIAYLSSAAPAIEGQGGNDETYRVACRLKDLGLSAAGALDAMDLLSDWNTRCVPPWDRDELADVIAHAFAYGENSPGSASIELEFDDIPDDVADRIGAAANDNGAKPAADRITAAPFVWCDPASIPPRQWLFGSHYIRGYATGTVAPGGTGKTSLVQTEALSMATGRDLIGGIKPDADPLRVWLWNLEDPAEEVGRRFAAAVIHHGIDPSALAGRLFVNSGRDTPLVIARKVRDTIKVAEPVVDALVAEILANGIDVLIIDPFVSSHSLPENDNAAMDAAVKAWARVAHLGRCAVELVHHSRKLGGEEASAESARGGSAFVDGCRGVRVINRMSDAEATKLGVPEPRRFVCMLDDKQNMAPPAAARDWYQLVSVQLPNGDNVAAVDRWTPPNPLDDVTPDHLGQVQALFAEGSYRESDQSPDWGGYAVANVLGLDIGDKAGRTPEQNAARAKVRDVLRKWLGAGVIRVEMRKDRSRQERSFFAATPATP